MAKGTTAAGRKMLIKLGNGADPEVFAAPCAMTSRGLSRSTAVNASNTPDCASPDAIQWDDQEATARSWSVSGSGKLLKENVSTWDEFFLEDDPTHIQIDVVFADGGIRRYAGAGLLTEFSLTGEDGDRVTYDITITGSGALTGVTVP